MSAYVWFGYDWREDCCILEVSAMVVDTVVLVRRFRPWRLGCRPGRCMGGSFTDLDGESLHKHMPEAGAAVPRLFLPSKALHGSALNYVALPCIGVF